MESLHDSCVHLQAVLSSIDDFCQTMLNRMDVFEQYIQKYAVLELTARLRLLAMEIDARKEAIYQSWCRMGYVLILMDDREGIRPHWVVNRDLVADRAYYAACGLTVLSLEEALEIITQKINEALAGNWASALDWYQRYGRPPWLNVDERLRAWGWPDLN